MISFACPRCQGNYRASDREAGNKFACPACGQRVQIPFPPQGQPKTSNPTEPSLPTEPPQDAVATPSPIRYLLWILPAALVLGLTGGILLLLSHSRTAPKDTTPASLPQTEHQAIPASPASSDQARPTDPSTLARSAESILRANCYRCHGENGTAEGGFNFILDRDKLVERRKLVPGNAGRSRLFRRVKNAEMPPEDEQPRPSPNDVAVLEKWIQAGAPAVSAGRPRPSLITQSDLIARIHADLFSLGERDRRYARYFTLTHLANAGLSDDELQTYRHALARLINSLSWHREIVKPRPVDPTRTILRIDMRDCQWSDRVWKRILAAYPHGVLPDSDQARECYAAAGEQLSYVRADWFVALASRPPLYHEVLQLPAEDRKLEEQLHIDVAENIRQERVARAGFNGSGISRNNRLIERHESPYGSYWRSYDFAGNLGRRNLFAHPLGPAAEESAFEHDGGEIIFNLPNGLLAFMLVDRLGHRLDRAPLTIVSDPRRPDRAVENGISCLTCHTRGLITKSDQIRTHLQQNPAAFTRTEAATIEALYPPERKLLQLFEQDNERFRKSLQQTGSRLTITEPIAALVRQYEKEVDLGTAAAELGLRPEDLSDRLNQSAELGRILGALRVPGGTVQRQVIISAFPDLVRELKLGTYLTP
jgi:mono/diheme cytochrome c family protein